ncbi:MAG: tetratricopeptide repeat protein [Verrucomicrobiae bacterium]|nr:tetratricopeptide repeat protein [Verrucomicrobiae bacterium]MDW8343859.1 tetratricopeptide repeat protein [Verrucomicrobiae bacterium]
MKTWCFALCLALLIVSPSWAAGSDPAPATRGPAADLYARGKAAADEGRYAEALRLFQQANQVQPHNPDTLNMIAFCHRKLGKLSEAFAYYDRALKLRPRFPAAREYLGEAHLQAALEQVEILKSYGPEGAEALADLVKAIKEAAEKL